MFSKLISLFFNFSRHFQIVVPLITIIKAHIVLFFWHYVMSIIILDVLILECQAGVVMGEFSERLKWVEEYYRLIFLKLHI